VANCTDIAPMKKTQFELERLAHYDPLTELPNRLLLQSRLEHAIEQAKRNNRLLGLLFIDLDDFKKINDSLGHRYGDELLVAVARRWRKRLRAEDTLGRLGGDEFVLLLENIQDSDEIGTVARDMVGALAAPFKLIDDTEVFLETSVGISIFPADGDSAEILLRNADTAMYRAKEQGRNQFRFYTGDMGASAVERLELETALRLGIERKELVLYFQPKVDLRSGKISGAEALIRWNRGGSGLVPPPKFIPLAEKTGLINPIGEWVIHEACRQLRHWLDQGLNPPDVAVNVSAHQIQKQDLRAVVWRALQEHNIKPELLGLEITESALMGRPEQIIEILQSLKHMGITISLDDFGTGYSNLSYLTRYPIDVLKIDASFIRGIGRDPNAMKVINSVIDLTHNIDLRTVAEGVETPEQLNYLAQNGCDYIQGYYFSKPLPAGEFETLLREGRSIDTAGFPI
jgi:diguanylate cyclase (GGDEF)-like protein